LEKKNKEHKIVCSESADNSAIIVGLLPLLLIGIPISLDTILMTNILQEKLVTVPTDFVSPIINNFNIFDLIILFGLTFSLIFLILSQKFLTLYYYVVQALYSRTRILFVIIAGWIAYIDHANNPIGPYYLLFLTLSGLVGIWLHKKNINPVPLIIGFILGDQIYWTIKYFIQIL
jgi:putative tricarboxylic transport membrane protein